MIVFTGYFFFFWTALSILILFPHIAHFSLPSLLLTLHPQPPNSFYRQSSPCSSWGDAQRTGVFCTSFRSTDRTIKFFPCNFVKVLLILGGSTFFRCQCIYPTISTHIIGTQCISRSWRSELPHPTNQWVMFMSINSRSTHHDNLADNTVRLCWRTQNNTGIFLDSDHS